jgi:hypothetical protein
MGKILGKKGIVIGIILLFFCTNIASGVEKATLNNDQQTTVPEIKTNEAKDTVPITLAIYGKTRMNTQTIIVPLEDVTKISELFKELKTSITSYPFDERTQQLKQEFITLLAQHNLIPADISPDHYSTLLNPPWFEKLQKNHNTLSSHPLKTPAPVGTAAALFCSLSGEGIGVLLPFIMLPRPRIITTWSAHDGETVVGKLLTIGGFTAGGSQFGFALGFWGIGLAYATPYGTFYGFIGYSLFASATAQSIERYPPDYPPEIIGTEPDDGASNVPVSLAELRFSIEDPSGDLMSYTLTTEPDIGSANGSLKPAGTYAIPIHGLEGATEYKWTISVSDDVQTIEQTYTFNTEIIAPVISNPFPADGERHVPTNLQQLQFTLKEYQGDLMDYTVETSPFIGSGSGNGVHNGTYTVAINGLLNFTTYRWYVNTTDGSHWTRRTFAFQTGFPTQFDPFEHGWQYRKQITINHTNIPEDLTNFPVLVSIVDNDLKDKAQLNGNDILFMNSTGFATRLNYEIEQYGGTSGTLIAWVNNTQLSSNEDTTFYMYYGNSATLSQQYPEHTWDSNYVAVWHFGETSGTNVADSTSNHFNGTANTYTPVTTGCIGNGRYFDMTNSEIYVGTQSAFGGMTSYTIEAWATPKSISGEHRIFDRSEGSNPNTILLYQYNDRLDLYTNNIDVCMFTNAFSVDVWTHTVGVFTGSGGESVAYKNGIKGTPIITTQTNPTAGSFTIYIGRACLSSSSSYRWYGTIDELRFSKITRSSAWISVSYQNQNDPTGFINIGSEEPGP